MLSISDNIAAVQIQIQIQLIPKSMFFPLYQELGNIFFEEPGKGYIFLHTHHFISGPENNPKVTELKFFMVFKKKCASQYPCERPVNDAT